MNIMEMLYNVDVTMQIGAKWKIYPSSCSPNCKFLDWENGVVGESNGNWELTEGTAKQGNGELNVAVRAKESKWDKIMGFL